uniref:Transmembrane protein n=1 Tax=Fagus sylvatica TaxID=28930 RepID=A0A2N9EU23_FAGSY
MSCGGLPIWVLGGNGGVLGMSCSGFVDGFVLRVCGFGGGGGNGGSFGFGFGLWGWKNGFGVGVCGVLVVAVGGLLLPVWVC